ncbi:MAG TPA: HAMP domain-containing methyl-accepting chemotaxis protein [Quisquiliibacterium sp.]|nr:HAMP domain-containing methyl-accepting chemotaxis protein [Quisquiliibacterium sp.]
MREPPLPAAAQPLLRRLRLLAAAVALAPVVVMLVVLVAADGAGAAASAWPAVAAAAAVACGLAFGLAHWLGRQVDAPLERVTRVLGELSAGDFTARTGLAARDEVSGVGHALDDFLDRRIDALQRAARDSEELNDSVIEIMQAVGTIATTKDLTIRVPVTENVTGAIADALNLLTEETRRLLLSVRAVSQDVARATVAVKGQSDTATRAAAREQREVEFAARELAAAAQALNAIAERARACNEAAGRAVEAAGEAMLTVDGTVQGIARSRVLIRETEKRIKRLGERSQEVGQVVGIIRDISERTGILALNASMKAAAAGEAGRSFAVVADEVKRLSESAREATVEIGELVGAIQAETTDTVVAMNQAISRIVQVSRLAEDAGEGMLRTRQETDSLAATVRDIARTSAEQAKVGAALQERARIIQEASGETARQLSQQTAETLRLVESAKALMREISVFKVGDR